MAMLAVLFLGACLSTRKTPQAPLPLPPSLTAEEMATSMHRIALHPSQAEIADSNAGCLTCHSPIESHTMHPGGSSIRVSCTDCHGGDSNVHWSGTAVHAGSAEHFDERYRSVVRSAHAVESRFPDAWTDPTTGLHSSGNPVRSYTLLNYENPAFIRFVNPGDLRIAHLTCGRCHMEEVQKVRNSMMTHGAQLWGAALYNNGSDPSKTPRFGESYSINGVPQRLYSVARHEGSEDAPDFYRRYDPSAEERARGVLDSLDPLPRWEITQMGNILRSFERGGKVQRLEVEVGLPNIFEEPGRPDMKLSDRGLGTQLATDPVFLGIQKTRLLDPLLSFMGTNDHPGDYRSSGCSACHVVYANDRSEVHSGAYADAGNMGWSQSADPTIPKDESGHPIRHEMTSSIPSSQCVVCHVHPGTSFANTYLGYTWWDNETHGELMYPKSQRSPTAEEYFQSLMSNP
ncbi:MAG: hypothetical protein V3T49_04285, partial [Dehalococcoidia bacterium]